MTTARAWVFIVVYNSKIRSLAQIGAGGPGNDYRAFGRKRHRFEENLDLPSIDFDVFEPRPAPRSETLARLIYALQESRIVLEPILEPIVFRSETDEYSSRLAVTRNDDFLTFRLAEVARQIVFDF
jgi:hypothetical protein